MPEATGDGSQAIVVKVLHGACNNATTQDLWKLLSTFLMVFPMTYTFPKIIICSRLGLICIRQLPCVCFEA